MSSETVWVKRWQGESPAAHLEPKEFPTLAELKDRWAQVERETRTFIEQQTAEGLQSPSTYSNFSGKRFASHLGRC